MLKPQVGGIRILETTYTSMRMEAIVNLTNPTPYSAYIPSVNVHILSNGSLVGIAAAQGLRVGPGNNTNLVVGATWNPSLGGDDGVLAGRDLLSQYISGYNVSITVKTHRDSIPGQPLLGEALSRFDITLQAPKLHLPSVPSDGEDEGDGHFIRDAVFHIFTSTATFTLVSPFVQNTLYIEHINATAYYNHTEPIGVILHDLPFATPPGASETPRLPVEWSLDSVGFDKLKAALGGTLKLDAAAVVAVRLGSWKETVWFRGQGIGAHVRP